MKIHLAGNDSRAYALVLHALGYPYRLASFYQANKASNAVFQLSREAPQIEWIMDSGLYSLMFGSDKGKLTTFEQFEQYAIDYVRKIKQLGWTQAIVECDVQRVLGVAETHRLRDEVFRPSGLEVIYVWHVPEGEAGLSALAKQERRVALSVPEFRAVYGRGAGAGGKTHAAIMRGTRLIRDVGRKDQRLHLLGNTEAALLAFPAPADTSDSTSWLSGGRFGNGMWFDPVTGAVGDMSVYSPKWKAWRAWCEERFGKSFELIRKSFADNEKRWRYYGNAMCGAIAYVLWMERINGKVDLVIPDSLPEED